MRFFMPILMVMPFFMDAQRHAIYYAAQSTDCSHLGDTDISDCTDNMIYELLFEEIDLEVCPADTGYWYSYHLTIGLDNTGQIISSNVISWNDSIGDCLQHFNARAKTIVDNMSFSPARNKSDKAIAGMKYFDFTYPPSHKLDSLRHTGSPVTVVEEMPRFTGCEEIIGSHSDKKVCSDRKLLQFLYTNLKYPKKARKKNTEGQVLVQYVVETTGMIDSIQIIQDIGHGCGESVLDVVHKMNELNPPFYPGLQLGKPVRVLYTLPVTFRLE